MANAVHTLLWGWTARGNHTAGPADVSQGAARATASSTFSTGRTADVTLDADSLDWTAGLTGTACLARRATDLLPGAEPLDRAAGIARAAYLACMTADALSDAHQLGLTAHTVT